MKQFIKEIFCIHQYKEEQGGNFYTANADSTLHSTYIPPFHWKECVKCGKFIDLLASPLTTKK